MRRGTFEMETDWINCKLKLPPNNLEVMTKIDDEKGCRCEEILRRQNRLWFFPDYSMYIYYTPTHWSYIDE